MSLLSPHAHVTAASSYFVALNVQHYLLGNTKAKPPPTDFPCIDRSPPIWPSSFVVKQRRIPDDDKPNGNQYYATTITYYDAEAGANLIIITPDNTTLPVLWDLELNSGQSYYFFPALQKCTPVEFPVGILRQNWLDGAEPMGEFHFTELSDAVSNDNNGGGNQEQQGNTHDDGRHKTETANAKSSSCGWTKADFIDYFADKETGVPTKWYFHTMKATFEVMEYDENAIIDSSLFDPPDYCFQ